MAGWPAGRNPSPPPAPAGWRSSMWSSWFGGMLESKDVLHRCPEGATKCVCEIEHYALLHRKLGKVDCTLGGACYHCGGIIPEMAAHMTLLSRRWARRLDLMVLGDFPHIRVAICTAGKPTSQSQIKSACRNAEACVHALSEIGWKVKQYLECKDSHCKILDKF